MKRSKKRRNHQKIANNYLGMAAIAIVVLILLVGLTMQSNNLKAIDEQKEYMQTDEYIAEVARDKLGLVKGNEIVFEEEK